MITKGDEMRPAGRPRPFGMKGGISAAGLEEKHVRPEHV